MIINPKQIPDSCSFEIAEKQHLIPLDNRPLWLNKNEDKKALFAKYIANNQLKEAWLTLNSTGWYLKDIAQSLDVLKSKTNDELFHLVATNWINEWKKVSGNNYYKPYLL